MPLSGQGVFKEFISDLGNGSIGDLGACEFSWIGINATGAAAMSAADGGSRRVSDIFGTWITHGPSVAAKHADHWNGNRLIKVEDLVDGFDDLDDANNADDCACIILAITGGAEDADTHLVKYSLTATNLPLDQDGSDDTVQANASGEVRIGGA